MIWQRRKLLLKSYLAIDMHANVIFHINNFVISVDKQVVIVRPLSYCKLISKLISKFMLNSFLHKKISSVDSQLSKEINCEILFIAIYNIFNFEKFCWRNFTYWAHIISFYGGSWYLFMCQGVKKSTDCGSRVKRWAVDCSTLFVGQRRWQASAVCCLWCCQQSRLLSPRGFIIVLATVGCINRITSKTATNQNGHMMWSLDQRICEQIIFPWQTGNYNYLQSFSSF